VPPLADVSTMLSLLSDIGTSFHVINDTIYSDSITLQAKEIRNFKASYDLVKKMRASILVLGPLLSRFGECVVSLPGGCAIGVRPVDLHLKSMEALGAKIELRDGYIYASVPTRLSGAEFFFPSVTVTGT